MHEEKTRTAREIAKAVVYQWDNHDKYRMTEVVKSLFDSDEPPEVTVARALLQVDKEYGCEIRDPNGTIWEQASNLQKQLDEMYAAYDLVYNTLRNGTRIIVSNAFDLHLLLDFMDETDPRKK